MPPYPASAVDCRGDERWLALAPADGSDPGQDLGPRSATGAGILATWSPDGTTVLAHDLGSGELLLIDIATGDGHGRPMAAVSGDYDWQRVAP